VQERHLGRKQLTVLPSEKPFYFTFREWIRGFQNLPGEIRSCLFLLWESKWIPVPSLTKGTCLYCSGPGTH
jgi:hypothetical protein